MSSSTEEVRAHYDREAADYQSRFSSGLLGRLRERERADIMALLEPSPGDAILDAGCGTGFDAVPLMELGCEVDGVDISPGMVEIARERGVNARVGDLHDFDLGRAYPKVLCAGPLEFCHSPGQVLHTLARHVAPHGCLVALFPPPTLVGRAYQLHHRRNGLRIQLYPVDRMMAWMRAAGLEPDALRRPGPFTAVIRARKHA